MRVLTPFVELADCSLAGATSAGEVWAEDLERAERSRHRRCDPGRVHRLLHPRLSAMMLHESASPLTLARVAVTLALINGTVVTFSTTFFQFTTCKDAGSPSNIGPTQGRPSFWDSPCIGILLPLAGI